MTLVSRHQSPFDLDALTEKMLDSYALDCGVNQRGERGVPSRVEIECMISELLAILFPGYLKDMPLEGRDVKGYVAKKLESFATQLRSTIIRTVSDKSSKQNVSDIDPEAVVESFLQRLPEIRGELALDVEAAFNGDPAARSCEEVIACYPSILAISIHRVAHELFLQGIPLIPRMMSEYAHRLTGIDIHPGAKIGLRFFIDHGTGTVIGETTEIGNNVRLYHGVTLGALSLPKKNTRSLVGAKRHPTLEDDVIVYSGATILGGETVIGKGSIIGGNVWITESVPERTNVALSNQTLAFRGNEYKMADFSI
ncbi:MAG: serine O-acetyltransferase EpsC [Nitrososphaerales archaeon]